MNIRQLLPEAIALEPERVLEAQSLSHTVLGDAHQWQTYLNGLALFSFERWWLERLQDRPIQRENCTLFQPHLANILEAVCNLQVGDFRICLIACESLHRGDISLPRMALELPSFVSHFYVLIEIEEEAEQATIRGILRYDRWLELKQKQSLRAETDWTYRISLSEFDPEPNHLLSYCRYLDPKAIALPVSQDESLRNNLGISKTLLAELKAGDRKLWDYLTWEQGKILLTCPEFLQLLYQEQLKENSPAAIARSRKNSAIRLQELWTLLTQPAIDTARWLDAKIDRPTQSLFDGFVPAYSLCRSGSIDKFEKAISLLKVRGFDIPSSACPLYQDIDFEDIPLRLCAMVWPLRELTPKTKLPQWALLLILGMQTGTYLPQELTLQVSNLTRVLHSPRTDFDEPFLYARVQGHPDQRFVATIIAPEQNTLQEILVNLPPYACVPDNG
ncbi:MAG: DUF1822 family protein [Cyanobacteria bacterium SBLK]|nr:DUF1822 family protein [Cyanobacteria bacterium SBLK]